MESLKSLLIANRGEIAVRITKTARKLGIRTIAIYTAADATSQHVSAANVAVLLGEDPNLYIDGKLILDIAKANNVDAVIPGYGFLSENVQFAQDVADAGIIFVGPKPDAIESFGLKHRAREMAVAAGVPVVPGTEALVSSEEDAVMEADRLGYPVMLKATAGGGGMGLMICSSADEVCHSFNQVRSRGETLFKNSGVFLERYYPESHHIEVQVFGNGQGDAIHFGERECSIQRRHQKVLEECPSPFVERHPGLREKLTSAAVALAESVQYSSAGTVEYLVDDHTGSFFFLEMNTRLQVEHGITELCYGIDLVQLMLQQADREISGHRGLQNGFLKSFLVDSPSGSAIEVRVYAENPARNYKPAPGLFQHVKWNEVPGTRIDTWVTTGCRISSFYDPMIAKVMVHAESREMATRNLHTVLSTSEIYGSPTNIELLQTILCSDEYARGNTLTNFLQHLEYYPTAIDVISPGIYTTVQDYPGRPSAGCGIPQSGPMDPLAFQVANILVGNPRGTEALEITLKGPELRFLAPAFVSICGAPMDVTLDGVSAPMWTTLHINCGQVLNIGKLSSKAGCRSYLAVHGGFPGIAQYYDSKSTSPLLNIGGYQGRALAPGDLLAIQAISDVAAVGSKSLPEEVLPNYSTHWDVFAMAGPYDEGYIVPEDIDMIYETQWKVSHNATRGGIRLIGPVPRWAREDGGEAGQHPANVIEYGYPIGTLNWTGESPCLFPVDAPDLGGFISSTTVVTGSLWRLGQVKSGDTLQYHKICLTEALRIREHQENFLDSVSSYVQGKVDLKALLPFNQESWRPTSDSTESTKAVIRQTTIEGLDQPLALTFRQGGDDYVLVEYGDGRFDLNHRCRVTALDNAIQTVKKGGKAWAKSIHKTIGCCNSLLIHYDGSKTDRSDLLDGILALQHDIGALNSAVVPSRRFRLPICFESPAQDEAIQRYIKTQRPHAPYLPSNMDFVAKINGITCDELIDIFLTTEFMAICVGFFCADTICLPIDPRYRLRCPKQNPSRVYTPEGSVSWGGSCMNIYPIDSPGGYQMTGQTIPCFDLMSSKPGFQSSYPGLFRAFDRISFYRVNEKDFQHDLALFKAGQYHFQIEETVFDMASYNLLLEETVSEVQDFRRRQDTAQVAMMELEKKSMKEWMAERAAQDTVPEEELQRLQDDTGVVSLDAPLDANVWKVNIAAGDIITSTQEVIILEAMKMEVVVHYNSDRTEHVDKRFRVEKVMVSSGGSVKAGDTLVFLREV